MTDEGMLMLCNYWTRDVAGAPGTIPMLCGMCQCQIGVSAPGASMIGSGKARGVCPKCMYENAPDDELGFAPAQMRQLAIAMGVPEDYIDECERAGIKEIAKRLHEAARHQFN